MKNVLVFMTFQMTGETFPFRKLHHTNDEIIFFVMQAFFYGLLSALNDIDLSSFTSTCKFIETNYYTLLSELLTNQIRGLNSTLVFIMLYIKHIINIYKCCTFNRIWCIDMKCEQFIKHSVFAEAAVEIVLDRKRRLLKCSCTLTSSAGSPGTQCVSEASRPRAPLRWSRSCSSAAGRATPPHEWTGRFLQKRSPNGTQSCRAVVRELQEIRKI